MYSFTIILGHVDRIQSGCFSLTVSFSATNEIIYSFNIRNESSWHEDDGRVYYCWKIAINYRVMGIGTCCGRQKILQRGGKLKAPSQVPTNSKYHDFWSIGRCANVYIYIVDNSILIFECHICYCLFLSEPTNKLLSWE